MKEIEIELKLKSTIQEIENLLLNQGFSILFKVRTIANYYSAQSFTRQELKQKTVRIRTSISKDGKKFHNNFRVLNLNLFDKRKSFNEFEMHADEVLELERKLKQSGFNHILTDDKSDYVYLSPNFKEDNIAFQIQNIKGVGLIIAYSNNLYSTLDEKRQRWRLIKDIRKYKIPIESNKQIDRFKPILESSTKNKMTIEHIIEIQQNLF